MSFNFDIPKVLQYAYNIFGSIQPMMYVYLGAGFAVWLVFKIIKSARGD
jgi:hypothetical protein